MSLNVNLQALIDNNLYSGFTKFQAGSSNILIDVLDSDNAHIKFNFSGNEINMTFAGESTAASRYSMFLYVDGELKDSIDPSNTSPNVLGVSGLEDGEHYVDVRITSTNTSANMMYLATTVLDVEPSVYNEDIQGFVMSDLLTALETIQAIIRAEGVTDTVISKMGDVITAINNITVADMELTETKLEEIKTKLDILDASINGISVSVDMSTLEGKMDLLLEKFN